MNHRFKRIMKGTVPQEVAHEDLTSGNWDEVRVETTVRLDGYQTFHRSEVIWDRLSERIYIKEHGVIMYWAPMSRCTFIHNEETITEADVREYPR